MAPDWREAVAAVEAALDRHEAALVAGHADELPQRARALQDAILAMARAVDPAGPARGALLDLSGRTQAQQAMLARRSAQAEASLGAIAAAHPALAAQRERRTYGQGAFGRG